MGTQESAATKPAMGKGSLDGLSQRLGALEESLTVVAGELGVSSIPKFKRLDPDSVYKEAVRRAHEAVEPLRLALRKLDARFEEIVATQAQIKRETAALRDDRTNAAALHTLEAEVSAVASRLDASLMPIERNASKVVALEESIARLALRLDTIWEEVKAHRRVEQDRNSVTGRVEAALTQRLAGLEQRLERLGNAISAQSSPAMQNAIADDRLASLQNHIADLERRLQAVPGTGAASAIDPALIAAEVARQIQMLVKEATAPADPVPLLAETPSDRNSDLNPLVVSATERAIVRLTHRLEKLEEWRRRKSDDSRGKSGLMGRLFES